MSAYGVTSDMVIQENKDGTVLCKDQYGEFTCKKTNVDSGLAVPARYNREEVIRALFETKRKKESKRR